MFRHDHRRGQSLVEFALVLPVFLLLVFGLIDVGRFVYTGSVLSQAAREGARVGSVEASWMGSNLLTCGQPGGPVCPADATALAADVKAAANRMVAGVGTISQVFVSCDTPGNAPTGTWTTRPPCAASADASGDLISVRVVFRYDPITPVIGQLIGQITRSASATMVIN